ncbi:phenylalanine--tRNA ligase subunit beta [Desulfotomaculum copahuensis]|uniref:Phenylalanine--tRNA ligase beta subunit n=1 Tax=Desulfotomaculum copahuensis TaxID=1838280 RepID=A0A1B7LAN5_9FIRM|nr:phenylalanine--tRNA ligase subunit beta [Desulfotomaculum copahuensis]OAT79389.1 phenylalanine--tRNA ligase subunit beta [Desulfotomaculum copahuensis]
MRVSFKWLREYVDIPVPPAELADRMTMAGVAVEGLQDLGAGIENVFTGRILKIETHPNADKLVVCTVTTGEGEIRQIVTGATNVREGQVVPVAVEGARLAGGLVIKKARLRGVESRGMLCSGQELGLDPAAMPADQAHGIMILPPDTPLGQDIRPVIGLDDVILELDLTPNRGDCLSMLGVAREAAALLGRELRPPVPVVTEIPASIAGRAQVDIAEPDLCRRYVARLFTNIKIGPSPLWMQERLRAAGVRPINNLVDITNYVMIELGQPLHAFDFDTLRDGRIIVRRARENEVLISLDNVERRLTGDMLVIADPGGPVAVAGVMGGLATEVTGKTTSVLLESAYFHPVSVRRTSRALGLRSEASTRFEKGIDPAGCRRAADRAAQLLQQLGAGEICSGVIDNYPVSHTPKTIILRPERAGQVLGVAVSREEAAGILSRLDFGVQDAGGDLLVTVPSHRVDVGLEIDLIEEVARMHGYHRIPATLPSGAATRGARTAEQSLTARVKDVLAQCGLTEVVTYSFTSPVFADRFHLPSGSERRQTLALQNPLSEEQSVMRTMLLPGLVEVLQRNFNRRVTDGAVFEIGRVYFPRDGEPLPEERPALAAAVTGQMPAGWNRPAQVLDFFFLKGVLETLAREIGLDVLHFEPLTGDPSFHPGRTAAVYAGEEKLGVLGELHPDVLESFELPARVTAFELDLASLLTRSGRVPRYQSLPRFPAMDRDLAVVVRKEIPAREVLRIIRKAGGALLSSVRLFDVYQGEQVKEGYRSLAFALKFQAGDRTLTDAEVLAHTAAISAALAKQLGAELRG